ncbi:MAG: hypothetical protein IKX23_05765 [Treponema sp.]|nr:hypothetical protein [Treponema sp.]
MKYGLIGEKLGHSFSKEIHNQLGSYDYVLKEIPKDELDAFMKAKDFAGINVTIPYKKDVIQYLDFIDDNARQIGAVNTIVNRDGKLFGYNTDFTGLQKMIVNEGIKLKDKKVLILGTGGTSRTAHAVAESLQTGEILCVSRSEKEDTITYEQAVKEHNDAQIIINTTPSGMFPSVDSKPIELNSFKKLEGVVDVIFNPLRTRLVIEAQKKGIKACGGLYMLVQQAVSASEFFFDRTIATSRTNEIYSLIISKKQNIVLTGMPGCGKSTAGKKLSEKLSMPYFDTDEEITKREWKTPAQIINERGEDQFRILEEEIIRELSLKNNVIISTGGGAVLRKQNIFHLKNNGLIFFIDRKIENIRPTSDRPLSDSQEKLKKVFDFRYPLYCAAADFTVTSDEVIEHTVNKIIQEFRGIK